MNEIFKVIEKQKKGEQLNILLELLQEKGTVLTNTRIESMRSGKTVESERIRNEWLDCELIKNKIRQLYNENIPNELPVQNIAQP